jgi:hypothetical protein
MAEEKEDDHGMGRGGTKATPEQTAAIYAAMMVCHITPST